jgi:hypothetical protein
VKNNSYFEIYVEDITKFYDVSNCKFIHIAPDGTETEIENKYLSNNTKTTISVNSLINSTPKNETYYKDVDYLTDLTPYKIKFLSALFYNAPILYKFTLKLRSIIKE